MNLFLTVPLAELSPGRGRNAGVALLGLLARRVSGIVSVGLTAIALVSAALAEATANPLGRRFRWAAIN